MKPFIGVIGATGDLGKQLVKALNDKEFIVIPVDRSPSKSTIKALAQCDIIHICAPLDALKTLPTTTALVVLHDSVMHSSRQASARYLNGKAAIVHMLMNEERRVIVASDAPYSTRASEHFSQLGFDPRLLTIDEHDALLARTQAPLALLCKTLLPYLNKQDEKGMLTPSGQLLVETLRSRDLVWTGATVKSILKNPKLRDLLDEMQQTLKNTT